MTLHFKMQRRIQHLPEHAFFQKTLYYMFDWVQNNPLEKKVFKVP